MEESVPLFYFQSSYEKFSDYARSEIENDLA